MQKEDLRRVMDMLSVREQHARTLLIFHRWDVEKLFAVYVDKGKSYLFAEAGVTVDEHRDSDSSSVPSLIQCEICIEDVPSDEATRMDCGHCFCNSCECLFGYCYSCALFFPNFIEKSLTFQQDYLLLGG